MFVAGQVTSRPCSTQRRSSASTSSIQIDIHTPLLPHSSPSGPNVISDSLLPRPPWPSSQRKISHSPEQTPPNVGGSPQPHDFSPPSFANQSKLSLMLETFRMGLILFACIAVRSEEHTSELQSRGLISY